MVDTTNPIVEVTNLTTGTYNYELFLAKYSNVLIQYDITSGDKDNELIFKIYGTVYTDANINSDTDWTDVTEDLTDATEVEIKDKTVNDFAAVDSQIPFNKIKLQIQVVEADPANNSVKIGFSV
ncbi:unnamed protein product [marine sediment metagenome]|uniref:Uncharacterized protein n=1 Tax=marine sediment metagenome TaxID=412755 RepID=X0S6Y5_9ZZZZ